MTLSSLFVWAELPHRTRQNSLGRYLVLFLAAVSALTGLSSCQRVPQAYLASTPHMAAQRITVAQSSTQSIAAPQLTASGKQAIPLPNHPAWEATPRPALEPAATGVRPFTLYQSSRRMRSRKSTQIPCDQIVLRSGDVIEAKVKEVGVTEIKYKKCDRQDGPDYTISKRDVLSIKYSNGEVERFAAAANPATTTSPSGSRSAYNSPTTVANEGPRTDPFAIVSIATGALAVLTGYGAFLLGAAAIVFGAVSLSRIRKEPARFKGKGLAIGGMVAGLVAAGIILLYILF